MRPLPRRIPALAASALAAVLLTAGCSELQQVSDGVDKAQQCLQAAGIVTDTVKKVTGLVDDPAAMDKALNDGATKLGELADKASNTTLKEAADGIAANLEKLNVTDANSAVDALQKLGNDSVKWVETLTGACA
ncbi:hypothetical protein [Streptosporangium carneum]|uniref:Secreted protein n=1 Tax=Streptosporangium carneum TaxID=47481 RepID=A0A9W6I7Y7_9ACTN|nr:hypothetical protein [Streptosporangium carneum]GLK12854.1 hypothetical protein GCM10017600_62640 [Streptosporangium carneum]